jgi:signal transduction histidine kinase
VRFSGVSLAYFGSLIAILLPLPAQPLASGPNPVAETEIELDPPDGDQTWAAALAALARAPDEEAALAALVDVVNLHRRRGDYSEGLHRGQEGLARARQLGNVALQIDFLYLLGRLYWSLTDYPRSLELHFEELKLAKIFDDPFRLARTHGGIGITYQRFNRIAESLHHLELGLTHAARAPDERIRGSLLNTLGIHHLMRADYPAAIAIFNESLGIRERFGNRRAIAESLTNLALAADGLGHHSEALDYLTRALATFESLRYRRYIANTHQRIGRVLRNAQRFDDALASLDRARLLASSLESIEVLADVWQEYALTHEARGDFAAALEYHRRYAAARDEVRDTEDRRRVAELRARYEQEQRELEIALLRRDQALQTAELARRRSRNLTWATVLIGGIVGLGAVIVGQIVRLRGERRLHLAAEQARDRAERAERLKTRLLQMASHDLKVPLVALHATAGRILRAAQTPDQVRRHAADIQADTARMRNLVRDFLDASAIEDGTLQVQAGALDLPTLAQRTAAGLRLLAEEKDQHLSVEPAPDAFPSVLADPDRLRQVLENLISNALKYTPRGSTITLRFGTSGTWAYVEVADNGPGLGPAEFAQMFAPRPRAASSPPAASLSADSDGLGLVIARELLARQGGRLEVESRPGQGSTFRALLAVAASTVTEPDDPVRA